MSYNNFQQTFEEDLFESSLEECDIPVPNPDLNLPDSVTFIVKP